MTTVGVAVLAHHPPAEFVRQCGLVEARGFETVWVPDERFLRDVSVQLTLAALNTQRIGIGSMVTNPYTRHPALTASLMASVDEVARGRLIVGIGAGQSGLASLGFPRAHPERTLREAIAVMRGLWPGEPFELHGRTTVLESTALDYRPLRPRIPVWIAARGPRLLELAGEIGDGVIIGSLASAPLRRFAQRHVDAGIARGKRTDRPRRALWLHTAIAEREEEAVDAVRPIVARLLQASFGVLDTWGVSLPRSVRETLAEEVARGTAADTSRVATMLGAADVAHFAGVGTPERMRAQLAEIFADGIDHVAVNPYLARGQTIDRFLELLAAAVPRIA